MSIVAPHVVSLPVAVIHSIKSKIVTSEVSILLRRHGSSERHHGWLSCWHLSSHLIGLLVSIVSSAIGLGRESCNAPIKVPLCCLILASGAGGAAALRRHDSLVCSLVGSAHRVEFGGVWVVIGAGHSASLACVVVLDVMAVSVTLVLVFKPTEGVLLRFLRSSVVAVVVESWKEIVVLHGWLWLHIRPRLLLPISASAASAIVVVVSVVVLKRGALVGCHRRRALLHHRRRCSLLHLQLLL